MTGSRAAVPWRARRLWYLSADGYTDDRKKASLYAFAAVTHDTAGGWSLELLPKLTLRPSSAVSLSIAPNTSPVGSRPIRHARNRPLATATDRARYVSPT